MTAFIKMHGLGNDFIVLDARDPGSGIPDVISEAAATALAERHFGIGCDQILVIRRSQRADIFMQIFNSDGSNAAACGNGTRCVAAYIMQKLTLEQLSIETEAGLLKSWCSVENPDHIAVDMGPVHLDWTAVPLAKRVDTLAVDLGSSAPSPAICQSIGNPHAVLFVEDAESVDLNAIGPELEHHSIFPDRANISFVNQIGPDQFRMRVWERGGGITFACGSGACAVGVAVYRSGRGSRSTEIIMDGGSVFIDWHDDGTAGGRVIMRGPVTFVFDGILCAHLDGLLRDST
ncbi:diaminopimelate epimerase [Candidatus Puniceispirillum sp.]|nr:diaminopimelate epimerase [Candidatus Puniceispirillum sp.]